RARADAVNPCPGCSQAPLSLPAQVGQKIFADPSLSASGQLACATCHDPAHAYASPNNLAVQLGGPTMSSPGTRAVPSLRYKEYTTPYADVAPNPDGVSTPGPGGGFTWDGRADTLADQAQIPLLAANEMANASPADVVSKLQSSAYADLFRAAFGADVFSSTAVAFQDALDALQAYQLEDNDFHPYSSRFDLNADNKIGGTLTASEQRGFEVFMDETRGNCFACHFSGPGNNGSTAMFTDFTYEAISVPRNQLIPANADPSYFDMGICSRADHPLPNSAPFCGLFKVPTLRNVATRKVFFHNGIFTSLRQVLNFYNTRDAQPQLWYPIVNGVVQKFDDLPVQYRGNLDTQVPLDGRAAGSQPPMTAQDLDDLEAFLGTLTDADVVNQIGSTQAVPALGTGASATRVLLLALLVAGLLVAGGRFTAAKASCRRSA
ncbi:MAG TPA: cytochrome c peroxidase, partial [Polyangia bacterium]|nr:cytochrome c peroxidase [Polyangia bacterium]